MTDASAFDKIRIGIAAPDEIRSPFPTGWSHGEVKKPETINYRTFKPERDGLFCERIFGPVKDWECHCGRYKKVKFKGIICDRCGVEVTRSKVRRERMGHIELAAPVCHIWYLKGVPSPLSLLLDISPRPLEKVLYFTSYIVTHVDRARINKDMDKYRAALEERIKELDDQREEDKEQARQEAAGDIQAHSEGAESIEVEEGEEPIEIEIWDTVRIAERNRHLEDELKDIDKDSVEQVQALRDALTLLDEKVEKRLLLAEDDYRKLESLLDVLAEKMDQDMTKVVRAGLGGQAIKELLVEIDLDKLAAELKQEIAQTQGPKRARAIKRLEVTEAFLGSGSRPEWMILDAVPVISPELRPMVQLDGGRFATSDLNDLYRRIINRNNRLKKITEIRAPESIVNHEKRLLQEAVDALIDNGRRTRPVVGSNNRPLKSLSDMLKGKEGRFRKNLLGKRVDYSGRSVIVVGPRLQLHQCGLPKEMAIELFKPFVMKALVERQYTSNIKTAKRMIDKLKPEVWDALEDVIKEHPVLLNRAPTLHRLGIQAFEPVLVDGKAIQVHPLVCPAFNADFDGDQMAVHVPLSASAQAEARILMLSTHNLFTPANGRPIVAPDKDVVLGGYYLTMIRKGEPKFAEAFSSPEEALLAYEMDMIGLHDQIDVAFKQADGFKKAERMTAGRIIFNNILPDNMRDYLFETLRKKDVDGKGGGLNKKELNAVVAQCYRTNGDERTIQLLDDLKNTGFKEATRAGMTVAITDMEVVSGERDRIVKDAEEQVKKFNNSYRRGLITTGERKENVLNTWQKAAGDVGDTIMANIDLFNPIFIFTDSGARGSKRQITQLSGMRGILSDPFGNLIEDLPVKSNFHEGLSVLEYFVSTHGARKGLADTALRTADAGYLTRRLVDVSQEVIVRADDCGTELGVYVEEIKDGNELVEQLWERLHGRYALVDITYPEGHAQAGEVFIPRNGLITIETAKEIENTLGIKRVGVRSPFTCELRMGICAKCYGLDLASSKQVEPGVAVGIIAAQSIGEPGTQLTMRTFHSGGIAQKSLTGVANVRQRKQETLKELHKDISSGLVSLEPSNEDKEPSATGIDRERVRAIQQVLKVLEDQVGGLLRVVELFEARKPKGQAIVTEFGGEIAEIESKGLRRVIVHTEIPIEETTNVGLAGETTAEDIYLGPHADTEKMTVTQAKRATEIPETLVAGTELTDKHLKKMREVGMEKVKVRKAILVPYRGQLQVVKGQRVEAGDRLTEGPLDPQKVLELQGIRGVQNYIVREIQAVYKSQGVDINDKHVEVIARQMLRKRRIKNPGDADFLPGQMVDRFEFDDANTAVREGRFTRKTVFLESRPARPFAKAADLLIGELGLETGTAMVLTQAKITKLSQLLKKTDSEIEDLADLPDSSSVVVADIQEKIQAWQTAQTPEPFGPAANQDSDAPGTEATADWLLLGITEASLATDSFLSAASFQKTTRVLTEAAVRGKKDSLVGLKENVIIGRLIPAGTGLAQYRNIEPRLDGVDSSTRFAAARSSRSGGAAVLDRSLDDDDLAVIREATGATGDSLAMIAERERATGDGVEPTIDSDSESSI